MEIDFDFSNNQKAKAGSFLVSEPFLADKHFSRSVIYLCEHNDQGSWGFVINDKLDAKFNEIIPDLETIQSHIGIGGPVDQNHLFFLHTLGEAIKDASPITSPLYIGGDFEILKSLLKSHPEQIEHVRFFIGYSGWSPGQLDAEINEKSWIVLNDVPYEKIFTGSGQYLWKDIMEQLGGKFRIMSGFPLDPNMN